MCRQVRQRRIATNGVGTCVERVAGIGREARQWKVLGDHDADQLRDPGEHVRLEEGKVCDPARVGDAQAGPAVQV